MFFNLKGENSNFKVKIIQVKKTKTKIRTQLVTLHPACFKDKKQR